MPSFIPQMRPVYPSLAVDLKELFHGEQYRATVTRVIDYLYSVHLSHSDRCFERTGRPGVITEVFCVGMATVDAHVAEIELCNGIYAHALGKIDDESIKISLQKYLETHTYVFREISRNEWVKEIKTGYSRRTGRDVPLYYLNYGVAGQSITFNAIQLEIFLLFQQRAGNASNYNVIGL